MQGQISMEIDSFLRWKESHAKRAAQNYRIWLDRLDAFVDKTIHNYTIDDILLFQKEIEKRYSEKTVSLAITAIRSMFVFLQTQNRNTVNPTLIRVPRAQQKPHNAVTLDEFQKMMDCWSDWTYKGIRNKLIISILWDTGIRISELCDLSIDDISPNRQCSTILSRKTKKLRLIFWSSKTQALLNKYLGVRLDQGNEKTLILSLWDDRGITVRQVQRIITDTKDRAGIDRKITAHSFRHGKAHQVLERGGTVKDVQAILGHSNPVTSFQYLHYSDAELEAKARTFLKNPKKAIHNHELD